MIAFSSLRSSILLSFVASAPLAAFALVGCSQHDTADPTIPSRPLTLGRLRTAIITSEEAPVTVEGELIAMVGRDRMFGVIAQRGDHVEIQVCAGTNIRRGWVHADHLRFLADSDLDLATEALKVSKAVDAGLDIVAYKARLDALADRVAAAAKRGKTVRERIALINSQLFDKEGFRAGDVGVDLLDIVLDKKKGRCLGLSVLYLCVTRKTGMPFYLVSAPRHVFVRYDDGHTRVNIETTAGGTVHESEAFLKEHLGHSMAVQAGGLDHLTLSSARALGCLLHQRARLLTSIGKLDGALDDFARCVEVNPYSETAYLNWAAALCVRREFEDAAELCVRALRINRRSATSHALLGSIRHNQRRFQEACNHYARAIRIDPSGHCVAAAYRGWGMSLLALRDYEHARTKFAVAAALTPGHAEFYRRLRQMIARIERGTASIDQLPDSPRPEARARPHSPLEGLRDRR